MEMLDATKIEAKSIRFFESLFVQKIYFFL